MSSPSSCPHCGTQNPSGVAYCASCRRPLTTGRSGLVSTVGSPLQAASAGGAAINAAPAADEAPTLRPQVSADAATIAPTAAGRHRDAQATLVDPDPDRPRPRPAADTGPLSIGQDFGPRYHIIRLLGLGGMGAVYQAWDKELEIVVALKVIRPEASADPENARELDRRFKRELLLAREVTHKNVVRIHDLGEIDGIKYITMSFVEGQDLRSIVESEGKIPVPRALRILRGIVAGLGAAHEAGVVHRDLKPANVMVDPKTDAAVIMDFGIARSAASAERTTVAALGSASSGLSSRVDLGHTVAGAIVGTIAYMAPEQAMGKVVDQRADHYALGLIVYDMLLGGRRASHAASALEEMQRRLLQAPPPLRSVDPSIPEAVDRIVSRCLAPDPDARFGTTVELAAELDRLDENGNPLPVERRLTPRLVAAAALLVVALVAGTWWVSRDRGPVEQPDPVSVLIADFENATGDAAFDGTLEPMLVRALDEAGFVTTYDRRRLPSLGVQRTDRIDGVAAREIAAQHGLGLVLTGSIAPRASGYQIEISATQTVTGETIAHAEGRARSKEQVLDVATGLVSRVRKALGDETPESAQQFAMASLSTTSLDVVSAYAAAMEASSANRFEEARQHATRAVELDPNFGVGYLVLAVASSNLGKMADREKHLAEALRHLDGMTERERYTTRGYSYWASGDYEQCVAEYSELIARYPADVGGRNQLAMCLSNLREMRRAMEEMREIVKILPSHPVFRDNLSLYASYGGDFQTAEETARSVEGSDPYAKLALAFAQLGQGKLTDAKATYEELSKIGPLGASLATSGLGDLAAHEGRFSDAVAILRQGAASDLESSMSVAASAKLAGAAHAELQRGRASEAVAAAAEALEQSNAVKIRFLAGRVFIEAGEPDRAGSLIESLAAELYAEPRAYAKILQGAIALRDGDPRQAMTLLREANDLFDTWIGGFDLGRASLAAGLFPQADGAFDTCLNARRGEALALFVDEEPTFAYLPAAHYYQGLAREGLGTAGFRESYDRYLQIRGRSTEDPFVKDLRERIGD